MAATVLAESTTPTFDLTDFVINQCNGVKGLSDLGLKSFPSQYIQPPQEEALMNSIIPKESIPVIDMSNWDSDPKIAESICDAAEKFGFFQLINHGVPVEVLEGVKDATHRFFGLPASVKRNFSKQRSSTNNVSFGTSFRPDDYEKPLEWKDYLSLFYVSEEEASALWPSECKDECLEYMRKSEVLCKKLMDSLMARLNVKKIDEKKESLLMGSKRIVLNYYPKCPPNSNLTVGVGRHSDFSTLTLLLQDQTGGLYVRMNEGWVHVTPIEGSLVINLGDALQILSNGRYKSVEHCVIANGTKNRISIPVFFNPKPSDVIAPLPEVLANNGEKPKYKNILYSDYVMHFKRKANDGKKTIEFVVL